MPLCLGRAGSVPLTVRISASSVKTDEDFLKALLPRVSRIGHLSLTGYSSIEDIERDLPGLLASPAPNLVSLELEQTGEPTGSFPAHPLFQNVPGLKLLHLTRTPLHPILMSATSLLELKISGCTTPFRFGDFVGFLRSNPNLEHITLGIQFHEVPAWIYPSRTVSLPRLRQLSFTSSHAMDTKGLISSISFPRGVSLEFSILQVDQNIEIRHFLPSPPTMVRDLLAPITVVRYGNSHKGEVYLSGNNSHFSFRCNQPFPLDPAFHLFNTSAVREFHTKGSFRGEILSWPLSQLPALEALVLVDINNSSSLSLGFLADEPVLCPSLKTVAFVDCSLGSSVIGELEGVVARRNSSTAAWLHRVVVVDRAGKLPNSRLICQLRRFVPRVDISVDEGLPDLP